MFTMKDILDALPYAKKIEGEFNSSFKAASIDSRTIVKNELFFAIKTPNNDGHNYIEDAFIRGASGVVVNDVRKIKKKNANFSIIQVPDTLKALHDLAKFVRNKYKPTVIAITGSAGKTTTKDLLAHLLNHSFNILKSEASYNNQYGVPLSILRLDNRHSHLVLEVGANHHGEINDLAKIAEPDIAIITNIGYAHIGNFGSLKGTLKAKMELIQNLKANGIVILNGDDKMLKTQTRKIKTKYSKLILAGQDDFSDIFVSDATFSENGTTGIINHGSQALQFDINLIGEHMLNAVAISVAGAIACNIELKNIVKALKTFKAPFGRFNLRKLNSNILVINDSYNSSPDAMLMALRSLKLFDASNRIAVLGEMKELGKFDRECHEMVGKTVPYSATHLIITSSKKSYIAGAAIANGFKTDNLVETNSATEALIELRKIISNIPGEFVILVKGSRFTHMERVILGLDNIEIRCQLGVCNKYINCERCSALG